LRHAVADEIRVHTRPVLEQHEMAAGLGLSPRQVVRENDGTLVLHVEPTPETIAELTAWLASRRVLLTELRAGSRSLEQAFLTLTTDEGDTATTPLER
jgi:hypothetical protein